MQSTFFGTRESTKKHDLWHEGEHQKARFVARRGAPKSTIQSTVLARGRAHQKALFRTRENNKNHYFVHEGEHQKTRSRVQSTMFGQRRAMHEGQHQKARFWHEGEHQKARYRARFLARGRAPKSTVLCTRGSTKKHDFVHEGEHQTARYRARFLLHEGKHRTHTQNNDRPKYKEILFLTVTAIRTVSRQIDRQIERQIVSQIVRQIN